MRHGHLHPPLIAIADLNSCVFTKFEEEQALLVREEDRALLPPKEPLPADDAVHQDLLAFLKHRVGNSRLLLLFKLCEDWHLDR